MGAGDSIREYNTTAASNTSLGGINLAEGVMVPSDLNNAIRQLMSDLASFSSGAEGIDLLSLVDDDASAAIKLQAPATVTTTTTFTLPDGDGTNGQVLNTDGSGQLGWASSTAFSSGMLVPYAGASAPSGWLLCYGQAVSRTTYAGLFAAVGTTYGSGDGSTTFNLPDLRGRTIAGQDDMGGSSANRLTSPINGDTLGAAGGSQSHTLTTAQMPAHSHSVNSVTVYGWRGGGGVGSYSAVGLTYESVSNQGNFTFGQATTGVTASAGSGSHTASLANTGSGSSHNNMQPTIILNYIIKT